MQQMRLFGECPSQSYNGLTQVTVTNGYCAVSAMTDTTITAITFKHPVTGATSLAGQILGAGQTLYGVSAIQISAGAGVIYFSNPQ